MRPSLALPLLAAGFGLLAPIGAAAPTQAAPAAVDSAQHREVDQREAKPRVSKVTSRKIVFSLSNSVDGLFETLAGCRATRRSHDVHATLVGPRRVVEGRAGSSRFNLLVHDAGTGGWFWNLRSVPGRDYATKMAQQGETSVVLDRLGYDRSVLRNGNRTCLDAQVAMVHQVVEHLRSGKYDLVGHPPSTGPRPAASGVVVHGHGTGALITQLAAARYDGINAVVLMSPSTLSPTRLAMDTLADQTATCLSGVGFAPFGATSSAFAKLLFASAGSDVRREASRLRNDTPCGDVSTLAPAVLIGRTEAGAINVPVLVLSGRRDARVAPMSPATARSTYSGSPKVSARIIAGAGSALPLERQAGQTRSAVLAWLRSL